MLRQAEHPYCFLVVHGKGLVLALSVYVIFPKLGIYLDLAAVDDAVTIFTWSTIVFTVFELSMYSG